MAVALARLPRCMEIAHWLPLLLPVADVCAHIDSRVYALTRQNHACTSIRLHERARARVAAKLTKAVAHCDGHVIGDQQNSGARL